MQAQDVMNRNVVSATPDTTVEQLVKLMMEHHISAVPIVDANGAINGLVSEGDLMRRTQVLRLCKNRPVIVWATNSIKG